MAYCKKCGAYIPDGLSACLACGYDDAAANAAAEAARKQSARAAQQAQPKTEQGETIEDIMARHRRLQQEKNRQWAEQEKQRRERQAENRQWAQEEFARRQAEREVKAEEEARKKALEEQRKAAGTTWLPSLCASWTNRKPCRRNHLSLPLHSAGSLAGYRP